MGIYLSGHDYDCLTNLRFADDVLLFATSKSMESTEKVGLRIHPRKTKVLSNQSSLCSDSKKEMQIDDIKIENPGKKRKREILRPADYIPAAGNDRNQESHQDSLGDVSQVQTGADIEKLHAQTPSPTVRRSNNSDDMLRIGNMGTTKEHERMLQSAQRKMLRLIIQSKRKYKHIIKHKVKNSQDLNDIDSSCTYDESEDGKSDTSHNDQDSEVSFSKIDNDEEIDAAEIEEGGWVEYIKRSTTEAMKKKENEKIRCWKMTQRKMKWRLAMRIATSPNERWFIKAAEWNPELSSKCRTNRAIGRPRKRREDDINEFLKLEKDDTKNFTESSSHINKIGSAQQKTAEDGLLHEENYTTNSVTRTRRNSHNIPARYVNGMKLSDEEIADIT